MAKFAPMLGNLSGSSGANTFSHNRGGPYLRRRSVPTNPQTGAQEAVRTFLATLSAAWAGLTSGNRDGWNAWATAHPGTDSLGNAINYTGHSKYVSLNSRLLGAGAASIDTAPVAPGPDTPGPVTVVRATATTITVDNNTYVDAGGFLQVWWSRPFTGARHPLFRAARVVSYVPADGAFPATVTLPSAFPTGTTVRFFVASVSPDGQASQPVTVDVTA